MAQVVMPQRRQAGDLSNLLGIGGAVTGGIIGGAGTGGTPQGAMMGATAGYGLGQAAGNVLTPQQQQQQSLPQTEMEALRRRHAQLNTDNLAILKQAEAQLPSLPEELRQQYAPAIIQARMAEEQRRGGV